MVRQVATCLFDSWREGDSHCLSEIQLITIINNKPNKFTKEIYIDNLSTVQIQIVDNQEVGNRSILRQTLAGLLGGRGITVGP